ncbi:hypothetical protein AVEN_203602-1, partial [Araneus ventricosus]
QFKEDAFSTSKDNIHLTLKGRSLAIPINNAEERFFGHLRMLEITWFKHEDQQTGNGIADWERCVALWG